MVEHIADRIAVMFRGSFMEMGPSDELYSNPRHPYTEALLKAASLADWQTAEIKKNGTQHKNKGCKYVERCHYARDICYKQEPEIRDITPTHQARCHFVDSLALTGVKSERTHDVSNENRKSESQ